MSKYSEKNFLRSFSYARHGILIAAKSQKNFIRQLIVASIAFTVACFLKFSALEFCVLFIAVAMVLVSEIFNSAIEFTLDAVYKNKYSQLVKMAKDLAAAAVCIASFSAILMGLFLFGNKFIFFIQRIF